MKKWIVPVFAFTFLLMLFAPAYSQEGSTVYSLDFDPENYIVKTTVVDGATVTYRAYMDISYVKSPVETNYQKLNVYVPESLVDDQTVPIFFPNQIGGYMAAEPIVPADNAVWVAEEESRNNSPAIALAKGYVVVSPGARGSNAEIDGIFTGKAPAAIVDLKAAVRYLRYNDAVMPGDAEKIISDGTSAGGALSSLLGSSGNDPLYEPYLKELGAADAADNIFVAISFCPIIDLEHADMVYESMYNRVMDDVDADGNSVYGFTDVQKALSAELKALYPAYLKNLGLTRVRQRRGVD